MATHVINKVNSRLKFLCRQNKFLDNLLLILLCNAMMQPFFDYACNAWYPDFNKIIKKNVYKLLRTNALDYILPKTR